MPSDPPPSRRPTGKIPASRAITPPPSRQPAGKIPASHMLTQPPPPGPFITLSYQEYVELIAAIAAAERAHDKSAELAYELRIQRMRLVTKAKR